MPRFRTPFIPNTLLTMCIPINDVYCCRVRRRHAAIPCPKQPNIGKQQHDLFPRVQRPRQGYLVVDPTVQAPPSSFHQRIWLRTVASGVWRQLAPRKPKGTQPVEGWVERVVLTAELRCLQAKNCCPDARLQRRQILDNVALAGVG
jgi:hypothetical protein